MDYHTEDTKNERDKNLLFSPTQLSILQHDIRYENRFSLDYGVR
jgi:hypothetical protein